MSSKMHKRGNNEGTIYKRPDGKWCAQITIGRTENGKIKRKSFYGKTRQEVSGKLLKAQNSLTNGTFVESNKITLSSWLDTWLFQYKKDSIRASTFESYEYLVRVHIKPEIGQYQLKDLRLEHIQTLYNKKSESLSPRTVKYIHVVLKQALDQALKSNLIVRNVTDATTLPRQIKKEMRVLTLEEHQKFLNTLQNHRLKAAFILALASGMREGELLALRWSDVNLKTGVVSVNRTMKRVKTFDKNITTKTNLIFQEPKTKAGNRTIPLPDNALRELKEHYNRQLQEKLSAGELYQDNNLIFSTELGKPTEPRNFLRVFYNLIKKSGLEHFNFHTLRHTYATRLLEANEHPKVVQELLGHSDISLTLNTYSHVMPEIKQAAAQKLNHLFEDTYNETKNSNEP